MPQRRPWSMFALMLAGVAAGVAGELLYAPHGAKAPEIVRLEFAGTAARMLDVAGDARADYVAAVRRDFALIAGYATTLVVAGLVGLGLARRRWTRALAAAIAVTGLAAGVCDAVENLAILAVLDPADPTADADAARARWFATAKFALLLYAAPGALTVLAVMVWRVVRRPSS